ncbi:uncharacterized protein EI97DRAFT_494312 [Westerdykella ornata]|uniref:PHD-type domain-containing protein n=1 Tax=Westerdykella ornata TaxID=318751 RepID=A0A6A6JJU9_WESOR|nr:uncharacterized protein EI97DRAFT_494312 [Westerdykella ornata]KAF2276258.1 hypothetical protein EI97DRAFT_494312 [Westerdykella ornata]
MVSRKRDRDEMEAEGPVEEPSMLQKLRNMWQFANLAQYLNLFIEALRIDSDFDIEDLENECLKPEPSRKLAEIGLALLKHVSSHKGLTLEIFDEYARRQYVAKASQRNPFGTEETPNKFDDFDVFTKIKVLQQLSVWTLNNPNSIREKLNATEREQVNWRIEPIGWDREGRTIYVLDDNRLYRKTDPPPPPPPSKAKSKKKSKKTRGTRSSKRRKTTTPEPEDAVDCEEEAEGDGPKEPEDDGLGGSKWECLCVTLEDYEAYMNSIRKSRDEDEQDLYKNLESEVLPIIHQQAEERAKKEARRLKEQEVLLKLATAKRSSRISSRLEKQKEAEAAAEAERQRQADLAMARAEQEKQRMLEQERDSRRMTREQRLREREAKRILEEEHLRKLKEEEEKLANGAEGRISERHLKAEMKRREDELRKLKEEEEKWMFDCEICGVHGICYDDGSHSIACERCNEWQHSKCHNISPEEADREDFHFICKHCRRKEEEANQPKLPPLKFKIYRPSNEAPQSNGASTGTAYQQLSAVEIPALRPTTAVGSGQPPHHAASLLDGPTLSPRGQESGPPPGIQRAEPVSYTASPHTNGSSPVRQRTYAPNQEGFRNGLPTSSPPPFHGSQLSTVPYSSFNSTVSELNGAPSAPPHLPNGNNNTFSRPTSSAGPGHGPNPFSSPVKHSPAPSPKPTNTLPNLGMSPYSSFPPNPTQAPSFSPTKHSSPPPPRPYLSSPAPIHASLHQSHQPSPSTQNVLPAPIPAPEKHDRPASSHGYGGSGFGYQNAQHPNVIVSTSVMPPAQALSPDHKPINLSPPVKKMSPVGTPERGSGVGNAIGGDVGGGVSQ